MHENKNTSARSGSRARVIWTVGSALALQLSACTQGKCPESATETDGVCVSDDGNLLMADAGGDSRDGATAAVDDSGSRDAGAWLAPTDAGTDAAIDPCEDHGCAEAASCDVEDGVAVCVCDEGYEGDGLVCERNLCIAIGDEEAFCGQHATCMPGASSDDEVTCACEEGFGDCDSGDATGVAGCETELNTQQDCGACGASCAGELQCIAGACEQPVARLVAGALTTCALMTPSTAGSDAHPVRCWGANRFDINGVGADARALGDPDFSANYSAFPRSAPGLAARDLALGGFHTCALLPQPGKLQCWGWNDRKQLGRDGSVTPGQRVELTIPGVTQIAASFGATCALAQGSVRCWGTNLMGMLGSAASDESTATPVSVTLPGLSGSVVELRAASHGFCARTQAGAVYCWGSGYTQPSLVAMTDNTPLSGAAQLVVGHDPLGLLVAETLACVLRTSGEVACWGSRYEPSPGDSNNPTAAEPPGVLDPIEPLKARIVPMPADKVVKQLAAGVAHVCALLDTGEVACLGATPANGALGFESNLPYIDVATLVPGINDAIEIVAASWHTCVRRASGQVQCWGRNRNGELGDGTTTTRMTPTNVVGLP